MLKKTNKQLLIETLNSLLEKKVTDISGGQNMGSIFSIGFDEYEKNGAFNLSVYCAWRLSKDKLIMVSALDSNQAKIPQNLTKLKRKSLLSYSLNDFNDLELKFEGNYALTIFCDISFDFPKNYSLKNWCLANVKENKTFIANRFAEIDETTWE